MNELNNVTRDVLSEPMEFTHPVDIFEPEVDSEVELRIAADMLIRIHEWESRGQTVSAIGMRTLVVIYLINPELIQAQTLEQLGDMLGQTRQNIDNLVSDFRDTFGGIQFRNNRSEATRRRSRDSHLQPPRSNE